MKRRKFVSSALAASALPLGCAASNQIQTNKNAADKKELYEIRTYDMKWGTSAMPLMDYLKNALKPALMKAGVNHFMLFNEVHNQTPKKIWAVISYPSTSIYINAQNLSGDATFQAAAKNYMEADAAPFDRYESWLLYAFDGFPKLENPIDDASIFELRTYEGYNEDALRRKIKMFNQEEFPVFRATGLNMVFFGEMIAGPYRPALTYMLNYKDMDAHGAAWKAFLAHPDWNIMKVKPEYANTVSNIRNVFLKPV